MSYKRDYSEFDFDVKSPPTVRIAIWTVIIVVSAAIFSICWEGSQYKVEGRPWPEGTRIRATLQGVTVGIAVSLIPTTLILICSRRSRGQ